MSLKFAYIPPDAPPNLVKALRRAFDNPETHVYLGDGERGYIVRLMVDWGDPLACIEIEAPIFDAVETWLETASPGEAKSAAAWFRQMANLIDGSE